MNWQRDYFLDDLLCNWAISPKLLEMGVVLDQPGIVDASPYFPFPEVFRQAIPIANPDGVLVPGMGEAFRLFGEYEWSPFE